MSGLDAPKTDQPLSDQPKSDQVPTDDSEGVDVAADVTPINPCEFPANPDPGAAGSPCSTESDCDSGYCLDSPTGRICSRTCTTCCPNGYSCGQLDPVDPTSVCIPMTANVCRPCLKDTDCVAKGDDSALCLAYGDAGSFCGGKCNKDIDCPAGYGCQDAKGTQGASKQCVLLQGECTCSKRAIEAGALTTCGITATAGACKGQRKCLATGLSACDAQTPKSETCNNLDDDCNGATDDPGAEGCANLWLDADGDTFGLAASLGGKELCLCTPVGGYSAVTATDCNDGDKSISPSSTEVCNDIDDNCDGQTDEGCDTDTDGYCNANIVIVGAPKICTLGLNDCDDKNPVVHPGATEICNDLDDNCNSLTDEGCDVDKDGYCDLKAFTDGKPAVCINGGGDCDDGNSAVNPGSAEMCNGLDDNCNTQTDEGCDADGDGYCNATMGLVGVPAVCPKGGGDCNDADAAIAPDATEVCNDVDDNCNNMIDEGCDKDLDGWCDNAISTTGKPAICPKGSGDCNDLATAIAPDAAEACNDIDDNCDGVTDEGCDNDGDGYCDATFVLVGSPLACPKGGGDCDDTTPDVSPAIVEICGNSTDDNCDGVTDEGVGASGCTTYFKDEDKDSYGSSEGQCTCQPVGMYNAVTAGDCADQDPSVHPGQAEICGNGKDDNCNSAQDEADAAGCEAFYVDADSDQWGAGASACLCAPDVTHTVKKAGDCDDKDPLKNPGLTEVCNGFDDNCDGKTDGAESIGCKKFYIDKDTDTFGDQSQPACLCAADNVHSTDVGGDCDDNNAEVNPSAKESCNNIDDNCDGATDEAGAKGCAAAYPDADTDGYGDPNITACLCKLAPPYIVVQGGDCNDKNNSVHPNATEVCNGIDDNCSGQTDEEGAAGCSSFLLDADGDTFGVDGKTKCLCAAATPYTASKGGDCDDTDSSSKPGGTEVCDQHDNDCNGVIDDPGSVGCTIYYADTDKDNFGTNIVPAKCLCKPSGFFTAIAGSDCDDKKANVYPGAPEYCDGIDTNCNGVTDDIDALGCSTWYVDFDKDTYGLTSDSQCACAAVGKYSTQQKGDCNDHANGVHPGAFEACNGVDDDCNGITDTDSPDAKTFYYDEDNDAWGTSTGKKLCFQSGFYRVLLTGDCDDTNPLVHPNQQESCNSIDDNCNGVTDEQDASGCVKYYADVDGDTYGNTGVSACLCKANANYGTATPGDCDDNQPKAHPGAKEVCDGIDNNCDTFIDEENALGCLNYYADADTDTWGDPTNVKCLCDAAGIHTVLNGKDCNDANSNIYPGATEVCNGIDDNCDSKIDEAGAQNCQLFMYDGDSDSYGITGNSKCLCLSAMPYTATKGADCNDSNPSVNPGVSESCGDGVDNNCDGMTDNAGSLGCTVYFPDSDKDGYGAANPPQQCLCLPTGTYTALVGGDCNDGNAVIHPNAIEKCNSVDDNCNGVVDDDSPDVVYWYYDNDKDTYGTSASVKKCFATGLYTASNGTDCDDNNGAVHPGATEVCNHIDDNCNSQVDDNALDIKTFYYDNDQDGWGSAATQLMCYASGKFTATKGGDCDESTASIYPGATEVCNGKDDDCNSVVDNPPAASSCGTTSNGSATCAAGVCKAACVSGWVDVNGTFNDGCECQADTNYGKGTGAGAPIDAGTLTDAGQQVQVNGKILPGEVGDWYVLHATDLWQASGTCNNFNVKASFSSNPDGNYRFDFYHGSYTSTPCLGNTDAEWDVAGAAPTGLKPGTDGILSGTTSGSAYPSPNPAKRGECTCIWPADWNTAMSPSQINACKDNSSDFYIRVYRTAAATTCSNASYTLQLSNGL